MSVIKTIHKAVPPVLVKNINTMSTNINEKINTVPHIPLSTEKELLNISIPGKDDIWESSSDNSNITIFIYGGPGIGKSSFSAMFPDTFHLFYEPSGKDLGGKNLAGYRREPRTWKEFIKYIELLEDQKAKNTLIFKFIVVDVIDVCFQHCVADFLQERSLTELPNDYGKSWSAIESIFREAMFRLSRICGVIFISHSSEKKTTHLNGLEYDTYVPTLAAKGNGVLTKFCDIKAYYYMNGMSERELVLSPTNWCEAKNRLDSKFRYLDGSKIDILSMGKSKEESWENFSLALKNKLPNKQTVNFTVKKG